VVIKNNPAFNLKEHQPTQCNTKECVEEAAEQFPLDYDAYDVATNPVSVHREEDTLKAW
jgi:hypothetical protein